MSTTFMSIDGITRAASWWRAAGFPVPPAVPDHALGWVGKDGIVRFDWEKT